MFKHAITTFIMAAALFGGLAGCQPAAPPDPNDPIQPEKVVPYNKTLFDVQNDLVGHFVVLNVNEFWLFAADDEISLSQVGGLAQPDNRTTVLTVQISASNAKTPSVSLNGTMKIGYMMVDGAWYLDQIVPGQGLTIHRKK